MQTTAIDLSGRSNGSRGSQALWITLLVCCGVFLSPVFACATPMAALAAVAGLKLGRRDALSVLSFIWLANQAIGYLYLGYPWTWVSAAWGIAIGVSTGIAALAASGLSVTRPAPLAISLPFIGAFAAFELGLYIAGFMLPGSSGAFAASIVWQIFLINAVTLCGLMAAHQLSLLLGASARAGAPETAATSFR